MGATLKIDIDPGTSIENAFKEAIRISSILKVSTRFEFNGVTCFGCSHGDVNTGAANYFAAIKSKSQYKYANCVLPK